MKFVLEIDLDGDTVSADRPAEVGRILRYWAGAMKQLDLAPGSTQALYDSSYAEVGSWRVE